MVKYEVRVTEAAREDLLALVQYIAQDNPTAALAVAEEIEQTILALENFPCRGINPKNQHLIAKGYKMLVVCDYLIFYVVLEEAVHIRRIISGKQNYLRLL